MFAICLFERIFLNLASYKALLSRTFVEKLEF
jgi:hypothetical protein